MIGEEEVQWEAVERSLGQPFNVNLGEGELTLLVEPLESNAEQVRVGC